MTPQPQSRPASTTRPSRSEPTEEREVRAADPALSPETNARLTEELREVVGAARVRVPAGRPHFSAGERPEERGLGTFLETNRLAMIIGLAIAVTFGAILALTTGSWWFLPLAAGVHAIGTTLVITLSVRLATISEHPSPTVAAAMTEEGVRSPDERFSRMVDEFREKPEGQLADAVAQGDNERTTPAQDDPATAGAEQSRAWTPTSQPSHSPAGLAGTPGFLIMTVAFSLFVFSIVLPAAAGGGLLWLTTAVAIPGIAGWIFIEWYLGRHSERTRMQSRRPIVAAVVVTALAVAVFCAVVASQYHNLH
jgi:hypothetical protein